ncbi:hypothetical protein ColTof4_12507 [Colletotrichum tofieldiae]|nr:hypothetical protein ColTof3_06542 [Colletotrichum tofieldiae]GKT80084.1 hypothetical protein ColTof4_12507 [Colletotrichum tofieldiae]
MSSLDDEDGDEVEFVADWRQELARQEEEQRRSTAQPEHAYDSTYSEPTWAYAEIIPISGQQPSTPYGQHSPLYGMQQYLMPRHQTLDWQLQSFAGYMTQQQPLFSGQNLQNSPVTPATVQLTSPISQYSTSLCPPQLPFISELWDQCVQESSRDSILGSSVQEQASQGTQQMQAMVPRQDVQPSQGPPQQGLEIWPSQEARLQMGSPAKIQNLIVGIGGCTRSGKSTLASHLRGLFQHLAIGENRVVVISQDAYFVPTEECPPTAQGRRYVKHKDCFRAVNWRGLLHDVESVAAGKPVPDPSGRKFTTAPFRLEPGQITAKANANYAGFLRSSGAEKKLWSEHFYRLNLEHQHAKQPQKYKDGSEDGIHWPAQLIIVEGFLMSAEYTESLSSADPPLAHGDEVQQAAYESLRNMMDHSLCLHVPKAEAKRRRCESPQYQYCSEGGSRLPHETWKTEEYFEKVAWPAYMEYHDKVLRQTEEDLRFRASTFIDVDQASAGSDWIVLGEACARINRTIRLEKRRDQ